MQEAGQPDIDDSNRGKPTIGCISLNNCANCVVTLVTLQTGRFHIIQSYLVYVATICFRQKLWREAGGEIMKLAHNESSVQDVGLSPLTHHPRVASVAVS